MSKEAKARIKINKLLEESGWRFFDDGNGPANIVLENNVRITQQYINELGENFEKQSRGFIDFLLLDSHNFPFIVLEAKAENIHPLSAKEQARKYARSQNCRYVILSNGNLHFLWDLESGNPSPISKFPTQQSFEQRNSFKPDKDALINEEVNSDYILLTQMPDYSVRPEWKNEVARKEFTKKSKLKLLRPYQVAAVKEIQQAVKKGSDRFLFEMATGTGKTLTAAAVIKLFLRTGNAKRVLFLVDRLELEDQANKAFINYLKNDYKSVIYKERKDDWRHAEIVVSTVQSLLFNNKFSRLFSPTDFDLVISDEAHRSIGGNARAVFEYFVGYKLGLTATPKDYLKRFNAGNANDPREYERRLLLDTYKTFGCDSGQPTFRYSLLDGVKGGYLVNPFVVDARTDITTELLSDRGYAVIVQDEEESEDGTVHCEEETYFGRDFEKKFFSDITNKVFCETFLKNALKDPVTGEIGKTIVFAVSQNHAAKLTQVLNIMADQLFPGKYNSDFALQVTSRVTDAQQFTINFVNNNLSGTGNFNPLYKTSKTRVCVTVGMMTTGYDCEDILNLCLMRPIFSPTDFIQIKGRGTRPFSFLEQLFDERLKEGIINPDKKFFKLFDFFANCEYFEEKFQYDQVLKMPQIGKSKTGSGTVYIHPEQFESFDPDKLASMREEEVGPEGMKIDRMFFEKFEEKVKEDDFVKTNVDEGKWDTVISYIQEKIFNKPEEYYTLEKLRRSVSIDRRISLREIIEKIFGLIPYFKNKEELLDDEFDKFILDAKPSEKDDILAVKYFFKAYITDGQVREIVDSKKYSELNVNPSFTLKDFKSVPESYRNLIPEYVKDYVPINKFLN